MAKSAQLKPYSLHPEAEDDLYEIWSYIAENNPVNADRVRAKIVDHYLIVANNPYLGHTREDLTSRPLRFRLVYKYLIAYAPDIEPLPILAVLHGSRNPALLRRILNSQKENW
jgi:plasmid stabilization system protein ParE